MLEAALVAAGLPVQRRQTGSFPSFRRRPSQESTAGSSPKQPEAEQQGQQQQAGQQLKGASQVQLLDSGTDDEEGGAAGPDMFFLSCKCAWDWVAVAGWRLKGGGCCEHTGIQAFHAAMGWAVDVQEQVTATTSPLQPCLPTTSPCLPACPPLPLSRDGYAVAIFYPDTATLSIDLLAASEAAILRMGAAGGQLCEQLVAEWPGSRISANTVSRLKKID